MGARAFIVEVSDVYMCYNNSYKPRERMAMLYTGIYEQIVNTRIDKELKLMDLEKYDISLEQLNAEDARRILTIYISYVINQGLLYLRDRFPSSKDEDSLLAQIRLCNEIVKDIAEQTGEPDFNDNIILEKGDVLTSLYEKMNSARSINAIRAVRPTTSIVENSLFTGSKNEPSMLSELKKEIISSDSIDLLVSFIKWSAIRPLLTELKEFTSREGVSLRIIATTYTQATDYKAIVALAELPNTQVKINYETNHARMHAKSYLFKRNTGFSTAYIGSSNLSNPALTGGLEWNVKVTEKESFDIVKKFAVSFESYWNDASFELFDPKDEACCTKLQSELTKVGGPRNSSLKLTMDIRPYAYQQDILDKLQAEREIHGRFKNLFVGATGIGKTVIAAFDYKRFKLRKGKAKLLFVAHRKEILQQSLQTFREILNDFNFGELYVDGHKPKDIDHLFISIQSLNAAGFTDWTSNDYYDFIIVDEFHHAAANSYQRLLNHYEPEVLLGLTATPDRLDGKDILKYFDGRIASSLLLGEAIDRNLLSSFQYFGVTDKVDYSNCKWTRGKYDVRELENLYTADTKRCSLVLGSVDKYVTDINKVKGLGFCVSVAHAEYMAAYFNSHGVPSIALSSRSADDIRDEAKNKLMSGEINFIFVVDLYNEGVDIPAVDTVLFLRPTESATVFLQQLGRGLRRYPGKECLTVLDFIGQANKRYNFAMKFEALAGKGRSTVKEQIENGFTNMPRGCYIELEKRAKEYIIDNLNQRGINKHLLVERVRSFTEDTGKELNLENFLTEHQLSLYDFYHNSGSRTMHRLKQWAGLTEDRRDVENSKNKMLTGLFHVDSFRLLDFWIKYIEGACEIKSEEDRLMRNMLYYTFYTKAPEKSGFSSIEEGIEAALAEDFFRSEVLEILKYNREHIAFVPKANEYDFNCPLETHCRYNRNQIMAAFGEFNESKAPEFREGVKHFKDKKTDIFLINLNKSEKDFSPSTMYEDYAINERLFHWQSQSQDRSSSAKIQRYINHREAGNYISLFVREYKNNGLYTAPFTFLGNADYIRHEGERPVSFIWNLHEPIPAELLPKANKSIAI